TNTVDAYNFTIKVTSTFNATLSGLSEDADLYLVNRATGSVIQQSTAAGTTDETVQSSLAPGSYRLEVRHFSGASGTSYSLNATADHPDATDSFDVGTLHSNQLCTG